MSPNDEESDPAERPAPVDRLETGAGAALIDAPVVRGDDSENVRDELERLHLPLLEAEGVIEWDRDSDEIRKGPRFEEIERVLEQFR